MRFAELLLDWFFPPRCVFCGKLAKGGVCPPCNAVLPKTGENAVVTGEGGMRVAAPLFYEGRVRESLIRFKFHEKDMYADTYGRLLAACAAEEFGGEFDTVTYIPVSRKRLRERGYDQAELLAKAMASHWQISPTVTLEKVRDNPRQSSITEEYERRANVLGAYRAVGAETFAGKRILLLDDIYTTGSTMAEAARTLKEAGAEEVLGIAVARKRTGNTKK